MWNICADAMLHSRKMVRRNQNLVGNKTVGEPFGRYYIYRMQRYCCSKRRPKMAWKAPKIVEVPVGMEINMYACAARK